MPAFSQEFEATLNRSIQIAHEHRHEYATLEHLLFSLLDSPGVQRVLEACGIHQGRLRLDIAAYIDTNLQTLVISELETQQDPKITAGFQRVVQRAHIHVQSSGQESVLSENALIAIFAEEGYAAELLKSHGLTRYDVVNFISHGIRKSGDQNELSTNSSLARQIPHQSPAPIRVEERNGKLAKVRATRSLVSASAIDFSRWRVPVSEHVSELLSGDFREGTNHSRVRSRLVALKICLDGDADAIKDRQFQIGYEVERLEGLINTYRGNSDDMPSLNASVLEDLVRLHIMLVLGLSKLDDWSRFKLQSVEQKLTLGRENQLVVSESLVDFALEMERNPDTFDAELPSTFRFLAKTVRDPLGATKTVIYGAVRSAENLMVYLAQKAIGIAKKGVDLASDRISKSIAIGIIALLAGAATHLSGALPTGWLWLKPLLEAVARTSS